MTDEIQNPTPMPRKKLINISDARFYQIFSLILALIILYMMYSRVSDISDAIKSITIATCNNMLTKNLISP